MSQWFESPNYLRQDEMIRWVLVASLTDETGHVSYYGLSEAGWWVKGSPDSNCVEFPVGSKEACEPAWLVPVLDFSFEEVCKRFMEGLRGLGKSEELLARFPFPAVVATALEWETPYWPALALEWVPRVGSSERIRRALASVSENRDFPEELRSAARGVLQGLRR